MKNKIKYLSTKEAGDYLRPRVSHSRVRAMAKLGYFPNSFIIGGKRVIPRKDLDAENKKRKKTLK